MFGLYDGLEEIGFKKVDGGYVFSDSPSLMGPRRRYLVDEIRKAAIAARIRQTIKEIRPFVLAFAILIPILVLVLVRFLVVVSTFNVTGFDATGAHITTAQQAGLITTRGTVSAGDGATIRFDLYGLYGHHPMAKFTPLDQNGKSEAPRIMPFGPTGAGFIWKDAQSGKLRGAILVSPGRQDVTNIMPYAIVLALGMSVGLVGLVRVYSQRKLRPLLVGLTRTDQRITNLEGIENFAVKAPFKLLGVMVFGGVLAVASPLVDVVTALLWHRPIRQLALLPMIVWIPILVFLAFILVVRAKAKRKTR